MALSLSKLFMRTISQPAGENSTGVSLWTVEDVEKAQAAQRQAEAEQTAAAVAEQSRASQGLGLGEPMDEDDDEYDGGGFSERVLAEVDLDI
jgi:DNA excision repair protein ERCC-2